MPLSAAAASSSVSSSGFFFQRHFIQFFYAAFPLCCTFWVLFRFAKLVSGKRKLTTFSFSYLHNQFRAFVMRQKANGKCGEQSTTTTTTTTAHPHSRSFFLDCCTFCCSCFFFFFVKGYIGCVQRLTC